MELSSVRTVGAAVATDIAKYGLRGIFTLLAGVLLAVSAFSVAVGANALFAGTNLAGASIVITLGIVGAGFSTFVYRLGDTISN